MKVGLLYEGIYDEGPLKVIIRRIIKNFTTEKIHFESRECGTGIVGDISSSISIFFGYSPCIMAIFVTDTDKYKSRKKQIKEEIKNCEEKSGVKHYIAIGCPEPVFEQWFFNEENAIKKILKLPGEKSLPFKKEKDSKDRMRKIIGEYDKKSLAKTFLDRYTEIAKEMNLKLLYKKSKSYKKFQDSLEEEVKKVIQSLSKK